MSQDPAERLAQSTSILWTHNFDPDIPNAGVFMFQAARALTAAGHPPELLYLGNLRSPVGIAKASKLVRDVSCDFDIVHSQFGSASSVATSFAGRSRRVVSIRGSDWTPSFSPNLFGRTHAVLATGMTRRVLDRYHAIISVSSRIEREIKEFRPTANVRVIPSPIDLAKFTPQDRSTARAKLGLADNGEKYVLFTAMNKDKPNKRRALAEAAIAVARRDFPSLRILIATGIPHDDMPTFVSAADVAICTSTAEGWPNSIKEALACNVPFVATDVSDLKEIADAEPTCMVVPDDAEALGNALINVLRAPTPHDLARHLRHMTMHNFASGLLNTYARLTVTAG